MRKVVLRMNEENKYLTIKKLVETNGNKKRAAVKLNCSVRTINRLIIKYKTYGKAGFVHGNRGRAPATTFPLDIKNQIIKLYVDYYSNANFTHFCEIVHDDLNVKISDTTLNKWLREENIISPKATKKTRKILKNQLKAQLNNTSSRKIQNQIKEVIASVDENDAHPRRPRCKYKGEMIQMDASSYEWIPGQIWHLHLAVDDATGEVVGACFDHQETLNGYYHVFYQILTNYGIPAMFYTDRRTVFEYKRKNNAFDDEDTFTQFSYACHNLGVDIKTTSIAQAKGRIERLNQTFQSRLPVELKRAHIKDIESANEFLNSYLKNSMTDLLYTSIVPNRSLKCNHHWRRLIIHWRFFHQER
ncbi:ISNCY family transposase [Allocoprobacillus halotolerans]|uniref:ISNCY family transposase n=2 Tax=Allocoprobacillus halotolerans TaxID=2944914 RepID=A0ABY5HZ28_9FIRM|nr:ISNCY family transposase [Allocoprobacillus halotolerans]UTY38060.1 ISNCY family transposase [Allocoprobacillus halotolerans]UTY39192.1 ISNCY family transposase [Allocoprobacillus halotolerans]